VRTDFVAYEFEAFVRPPGGSHLLRDLLVAIVAAGIVTGLRFLLIAVLYDRAPFLLFGFAVMISGKLYLKVEWDGEKPSCSLIGRESPSQTIESSSSRKIRETSGMLWSITDLALRAAPCASSAGVCRSYQKLFRQRTLMLHLVSVELLQSGLANGPSVSC
jgi:hypothetical protein